MACTQALLVALPAVRRGCSGGVCGGGDGGWAVGQHGGDG